MYVDFKICEAKWRNIFYDARLEPGAQEERAFTMRRG